MPKVRRRARIFGPLHNGQAEDDQPESGFKADVCYCPAMRFLIANRVDFRPKFSCQGGPCRATPTGTRNALATRTMRQRPPEDLVTLLKELRLATPGQTAAVERRARRLARGL
ncbi:MAG TPA: hypothetical protein DD670_01630, partial [Planctomycetaceae bacterium]|nr:hypothetical protein [Planctomycetaceae bacterium]